MGKKEYLLQKMLEMGDTAFTLKLCDILDNAGWACTHCSARQQATAFENYRYIMQGLPTARLTGVNARLASRITALINAHATQIGGA
jgi:hypothetical protein